MSNPYEGLTPGSRLYAKASAGKDGSLEANVGRRIKPQPNGCWYYNDDPDNYGTVNAARAADQSMRAHRWVYGVLVGPIPDDHVLHHTCEHKGCCNPAHLEPMTPGDHSALHARLRRAS